MIYLDNAATSHPPPKFVLEAVADYLTEIGAGPGRSSHRAATRPILFSPFCYPTDLRPAR